MLKASVQNLVSMGIMALLLFVPAGTLAWPQAWIFLALFYGCSIAFGLWLRAVDPAALAERMKSPLGADQRPRDRMIMGAIMVGFALWFILAALDARRFGWTHVPSWAQVVGAVLVIIPFYGWMDVMRANSFAGTRIRVQPERRQTVIDSGPYALIRHPMYAYALVQIIGAALLLGTLWALAGAIPLLGLLAARIRGEEAVLMDALPGYRAYAARVRYRLLPGVW